MRKGALWAAARGGVRQQLKACGLIGAPHACLDLLHPPFADGSSVAINLPIGWLLLGGAVYYLYSSSGSSSGGGGPKQEISFQEFRNQLLAKVRL